MLTSTMFVGVSATSESDNETSLIYFDANTVGWKNYEKIYCSVRRTNGHRVYDDYSEESLCTDKYGHGIWSYDMSDILHLFDTYYSLTLCFYNENGKKTSVLTMHKDDLGDTVFSTSMRTNITPTIKWTKNKTANDAISMYESKYDVKLDKNRYYFLFPNGENGQKGDDPQSSAYGKYAQSWLTEYSDTPAVYWWDTDEYDPAVYPGYNLSHQTSGIYYADIPKEVKQLIFSNNIKVSHDAMLDPMMQFVRDTVAIDTQGKENMIYVIDPDTVKINEVSKKQTFDGNWYYFYGNGCYGTVKGGRACDCIRDDHKHGVPTSSEISAKDALEQYESQTGEDVPTYRYYFMMPNGTNCDMSDDPYSYADSKFAHTWYNEYTDGPAIYWWDTLVYSPGWPGYVMEESDTEDVFYADVPVDATTIIFSNNVAFPYYDTELSMQYDYQTINIPCEYYDPGESPNYPDGTDSFDNMIFIIDPDLMPVGDLTLKETYSGEWYYYYGNGCYGFTKDGTTADCLHPSHYDEKGNHISMGILGDVDLDSKLSVMDATEIQMVLSQLKAFVDKKAEALADFDGDDSVSVMDATAIQQRLANLD